MPYAINKYNGTLIATVADGTIDNTTDLKFIGKNYAGYGEVQNENFLFLLENFANNSAPPRPLSGQLWFDLANSKLKFYDGSKWRTTGGAETGGVAPIGLSVGDFWFDTTNNQLYSWDGSAYQLIGPQGVPGSGQTQMQSVSVKDLGSQPHPIIKALSNGSVVFTISEDYDFALNPTLSNISGYMDEGIKKGITLKGLDEFGKTTDYKLHGTATTADGLINGDGDVLTADDFVTTQNAIFPQLVQFGDSGYTVGNTPYLKVRITGGNPVIQNQLGDTIIFQTSGGSYTPFKLVGANILPGSSNVTDIGSSGARYKTVYAGAFDGPATQADSLKMGPGDYRTGSSSADSGTVAVRTTITESIGGVTVTPGSIKANFFVGTATAANYADLAEKYLADAEYEVGTVVCIGGEKEITACQKGTRAIGAVSANPAYLMNLDLEGGTAVALKGRVPVKVTGPITKGDRLIAGDDGTAISATWNTFDTFGVALESNNEEGVKLVECLIL